MSALASGSGQQEPYRFTANLKAVMLGEALARHGLSGYRFPEGLAPFKEGAQVLTLKSIVVPPESYVAGEQMLIRAALPGNAFGLLQLFSVIEKQEIPENLRGKVVLVATDVLVAGSGGRYVACGDWSGYDREWILFVRGLGFDFSPRYHVVRLG